MDLGFGLSNELGDRGEGAGSSLYAVLYLTSWETTGLGKGCNVYFSLGDCMNRWDTGMGHSGMEKGECS